jgi:hypothetical protein
MTDELFDRVPAVFGLGDENHVWFIQDQGRDPGAQQRVVVDGQNPNLVLAHAYSVPRLSARATPQPRCSIYSFEADYFRG